MEHLYARSLPQTPLCVRIRSLLAVVALYLGLPAQAPSVDKPWAPKLQPEQNYVKVSLDAIGIPVSLLGGRLMIAHFKSHALIALRWKLERAQCRKSLHVRGIVFIEQP
eukprot:1936449-Amphidinium_carterae.2